MSDHLIHEARRRGKSEAERRDLQYQIDDAYKAEIERVEEPRRQQARNAQKAQERRERLERVRLTVAFNGVKLAWLVLCVFIAYDRTWEEVAALDDFLWGKEWLAYVGLVFIYLFGRHIILILFDAEDR